LFHEGVIVSTRKLVYDAGSNEDAIKALMQAQHKAVMKDLRKGTFDEKIDQYLGGTPGLEPRAGVDPNKAVPRGERAKTEADPDAALAALEASGGTPIEIVNEGLSEPIELPIKKSGGVPVQSRTGTGDRTIRVVPKEPPPPSSELDGPTDRSDVGDVASAIRQANAGAPATSRTQTAQKGSKQADVARAPTQLATKSPAVDAESRDSALVIEISVDDDSDAQRLPRDTNVEQALPPRTATPNRPASHGAAALPAMKQGRPIAPPVVTRPATQDRKRPESDVIEVYSPPPPSVEPPPGERSERPGQYSMNRKEGAPPIREQTGRIEKIEQPAQARARNPGSGANPVVATNDRGSGPAPRSQQAPARGGLQPPPLPPTRPNAPAAGARTGQPQGRVQPTAPITSRTPQPAAGSGVVMTRPAVIVGAPPKPPQQPRVRKAREDEGRGFGQGLISEKSLDEVILAYLSEDAEEK
jgi:hypothetical protein